MRVPRNSHTSASTIASPCNALVSMVRIALRVGIVWSSASTRRSPPEDRVRFFSSM